MIITGTAWKTAWKLDGNFRDKDLSIVEVLFTIKSSEEEESSEWVMEWYSSTHKKWLLWTAHVRNKELSTYTLSESISIAKRYDELSKKLTPSFINPHRIRSLGDGTIIPIEML